MKFITASVAALAVTAASLTPPVFAQAPDVESRQVGVCVNVDYRGTTEDRTDFGQSDQRVPVAYRYNPLIVMKWNTARDGMRSLSQVVATEDSPVAAESAPYINDRLAWLENDDNRRAMARIAPPFWNLESKHTALMIHDAPMFAAPSETCGWKNAPPVLEGEYALFHGERAPRVRGDLCDDEPLIVFEGITKPQIARFYQSALAQPEGVPLRRLLTPLSLEYRADSFLTDMGKILAISEMQCGTPVERVSVIFERQARPLHLPMARFDQDTMESALSLTVMVDDGMLRAEVTQTSRQSANAEAAVARVRARAERAAAHEAGGDLRFAIGTLLVFGSFAVVATGIGMRCEKALDNLNPFWQPPAHC